MLMLDAVVGDVRLAVRTLRRPVAGRYRLAVTVTDRRGRTHRLRSVIML